MEVFLKRIFCHFIFLHLIDRKLSKLSNNFTKYYFSLIQTNISVTVEIVASDTYKASNYVTDYAVHKCTEIGILSIFKRKSEKEEEEKVEKVKKKEWAENKRHDHFFLLFHFI